MQFGRDTSARDTDSAATLAVIISDLPFCRVRAVERRCHSDDAVGNSRRANWGVTAELPITRQCVGNSMQNSRVVSQRNASTSAWSQLSIAGTAGVLAARGGEESLVIRATVPPTS